VQFEIKKWRSQSAQGGLDVSVLTINTNDCSLWKYLEPL